MNQSHVFATLFTGSMCLGATICHVIERKSLGLKIFDKENWIGRSILGGWCGLVLFSVYGN